MPRSPRSGRIINVSWPQFIGHEPNKPSYFSAMASDWTIASDMTNGGVCPETAGDSAEDAIIAKQTAPIFIAVPPDYAFREHRSRTPPFL
jgi:hypothetical protein